MLRTLTIPAAVILVAGTAAFRIHSPVGHSPAVAPDSTDQEIVSSLITANRTEINQAREALASSKDKDVRKFAQMMITDHSKALTVAESIGKRLGYATDSLPRSPDVTTRDSTVVRDSNNVANKPYPRNNDSAAAQPTGGVYSDQEYVNAQVAAHEEVLDKLRSAATDLKDDELKKHVADTQDVVKAHLKEARRLQSKLERTS